MLLLEKIIDQRTLGICRPNPWSSTSWGSVTPQSVFWDENEGVQSKSRECWLQVGGLLGVESKFSFPLTLHWRHLVYPKTISQSLEWDRSCWGPIMLMKLWMKHAGGSHFSVVTNKCFVFDVIKEWCHFDWERYKLASNEISQTRQEAQAMLQEPQMSSMWDSC